MTTEGILRSSFAQEVINTNVAFYLLTSICREILKYHKVPIMDLDPTKVPMMNLEPTQN